MASKTRILVGTVGQGVMMSGDDGENWTRISVRNGMHTDGIVRSLLAAPHRPETVYAGTDMGLYRSDDAGMKWRLLNTPMSGSMVWSLAADPKDERVLFAGVGTPSTPGIYRSTDGGETWQHRPMEIAKECPNVGIPRPTGIAIDPTDSRHVWVGFEVDGVRHSADGGATWARINGQIPNPDVHNVLVTAGPPKVVFTLVNDDVWRSTDDGKTWQAAHAREVFPWRYPRGIAVKPDDPRTLFLTLGDATPGRVGTVMRSKDAGATWANVGLPVQPNSAVWTVSIPVQAPNTVFAASRYGYLYRSDDGGDSWRKLWREFSEVSSVLCIPQ
ncbi:MAG: WD40/YVTN/BNR-like repeat-containing protein [Burkholderiales bacterium]